MNDLGFDAALGFAVMVLVWLALHRGRGAVGRLSGLEGRDAPVAERIGIAALLASACAHLRAGGTLDAALLGRGSRLPGEPAMLQDAITTAVSQRRLPTESAQQVHTVSSEIALAHRLSTRSGCEESRCLQAVAGTHKQASMLEELRRNAFAMPRATVKLLTLLPFATIIVEELSGAHPLGFLFGSAQGLVCLLTGGFMYVAGLAWIALLMRQPPQTGDIVARHPARSGAKSQDPHQTHRKER